LAIVGASLAGISAARAARAQGFAGRLVIIGEEPHRPYDRPPLSKDFLAGKITVQDLGLESPDDAQGTDPLRAEWLLGAAARSLDAATRTLTLTDGTVPLSRPFGREMAADISALHEINGVELICDAAIESYYSGEGVVSGLGLADGRCLPADVVLVAVGDCAAWLDEESGKHWRLEHWAGAVERPAGHCGPASAGSIGQFRLIVSDLPNPTSVTAEE
jgi:NADPH-dependent 2,4-dienoyl-CoA reductase/sulfur reductase-like enzyme